MLSALPNAPITLQAKITKRQSLTGIFSASGVEWANEHLLVIGDDAPGLYILDQQWNLVNTIALLSSALPSGRIPKKEKPDFEMLTAFRIDGREMLLVAGSGSKSPQRDMAYLIQLSDYKVSEPLSMQACYDVLRGLPDVVGSSRLNLEGLAASSEQLFMLQRGNISGQNVVITYELRAFYAWLTGTTNELPSPTVRHYHLLAISGIQSGFSGATLVPETSLLLFTASVENTSNEIDDGESLGSWVGLIDLHQSEASQPACVLLTEGDRPYLGKVESITVREQSAGFLRAIAVTDNDSGASEILEIELSW